MGVLMMREDGTVMSGRPTHVAGASSSCAALPASGSISARPEQGLERASAPPAHLNDTEEEQALWQEFRDHGSSLNRALNEALRIHKGPAWHVFQVRDCLLSFSVLPSHFFRIRASLDLCLLCFIYQQQDLEDRARERYGTLDQMNFELRRLREQRGALNTLVEALRTDNGWLVYRAEALWDLLLELDAQAMEGASAIEKVQDALVEWDEALQRVREDLAKARTLAAEWETKVASVRAQLQQDRATLEGARGWQRQAEEKAKEAEEPRTSATEKVASLELAEEQLRQERVARQQAEDQLQQERAALVEARAALERERLAREEAQGRLQQERTALEGAQATLKQRGDGVSRLHGELTRLSISHKDLRQFLEEQEATVCDLRREDEEPRKALDSERRQVKGESLFCLFRLLIWLARDSLPTFVSLSLVFRPANCPGEYDHPGRGCADGLQLLTTGVGEVASCRPRGLPGG
jgi:hypothetical protein